MPIYEYACDACGFEAEFLRKVSDPLLTDCPECGKATFHKLVSVAGFQLKGTGWYVTDFKNKDKGAKRAAGKDAPAVESDSKSAGDDSKPAEKKENPAETKKEQSVSGT